MCGIFFQKVDYIDRKIIVFEVKKRAYLTPCKTRSANIESSWFWTFSLHKVEAFDIMLKNWVENPPEKKRKKNPKKYLFSFF
jgi:hypothetical protein